MIVSASNDENPLLNAALAYAARGWRVLPLHSFADGLCTCENPNCDSPAKHPLTPNGVHGATTDEATIVRWWTEAPTANVGIATGNGLVVLDVDAKNSGLESLAALEKQKASIPSTLSVNTGGGGRHIYLHCPEGVRIGNRVGIAPGLDIRSDDAYVVAPPSLHASGRCYERAEGPDTPMAPMPAWLLDLAVNKPVNMPSTSGKNGLVLTVRAPAEDLASHPGAEEGQRNATLCRLAGNQLARGDDPDDIEDEGLLWGDRCRPPLSAAEVRRTLASLVAKHRRTTVVQAPPADHDLEPGDDIDDVPLPAAPRWPILHADALHGLAGELLRLLEPHTEADPVGLLLTFLTCFGNVIGRTAHFQVEGTRHHGNLFVVLVGDSSRGRKGTSLGRILSLFEAVDPEWKRDCIATGLSSGEGLIHSVRDPVETMEPVKEKGKVAGYQKVVRDHGVTDKRRMVNEPEFGQTLKVMGREGNTLSPVKRQAWDGEPLAILTKSHSARATGAHISILGHITRPELEKCLDDTDCWNGFANRILWALVRRSKLLPEGGQAVDLRDIQRCLAAAVNKARTITQMSRSPQARAQWHDLYTQLTAERHGLVGAVTGRGEAQTLRLSMLYALLDGQSIIDVPHLRAALALWNYCLESAEIVFGGQGEADQADPLERLLLQKIRAEPGINRRGLHRVIGGHVPADMMVKALGRLRDSGQARAEMKGTGGRPSECWFPVQVPALPPSPGRVEEPPARVLPDTPTTPRLTLVELFEAVSRIGGRVKRDGDRCVVEAPAGRITCEITAAMSDHQQELLSMLPTAPEPPKPEPPATKDEMTEEEFNAALDAM